MKEYDIEFSATVKVKAGGDTDEIIKAAFDAFVKQMKPRKGVDLKEMFTAVILHESK